jgi:hypothetical protein
MWGSVSRGDEGSQALGYDRQHKAAVRMLFDYLVTGGILEH